MPYPRKTGSLINWRSTIGYLALLAGVAIMVTACLMAQR